MKRYMVFFGFNYNYSGGMNDFVGDFDTLEEAHKQIYQELQDPLFAGNADGTWAHIYDCQTQAIVWNNQLMW